MSALTDTTPVEKPPLIADEKTSLTPHPSADAPIPAEVEGTYLDSPPAYDFHDLPASDRKELLTSDARSLNSSTSDTTTVSNAHEFQPTRILLIGARGIRFVRLPLPSGQLEIPITDSEGQVVYTSTRAKKSSGNAILSNADGTPLLSSEYNFGPGKEPKIRVLDGSAGDGAEIVTKGKWTSRRQEFVLPNERGTFTWRYTRERDAFASAAEGKDKKRTHLVLEVSAPPQMSTSPQEPQKKKEKVQIRRVAELIRNTQTRAPGTSSSDAGNGGELRFDAVFCESVGLREEVVVASLLMMLKKEIDRRRVVQAMIIAGLVS